MKRKELTAYDKWLTRRKWRTGEIISPEKAADLYLAEHPLPPAEGAETILHRHIDKQSMDELSVNVWPDILEAMQEFASQQHPTAEGAEEILDGMDLGEPIQTGEFYYRSEVLKAMTEFATLHAQRIADKMVSERLREELIKYSMYASEQWCDTSDRELSEKNIDAYLNGRNK